MRLQAVYDFGGIYLDTDVELLKSLNPLLSHSCFFGFESAPDDPSIRINNAVFGSSQRNSFIKRCKTRLLTDFSGDEPAYLSSPKLTTRLLRELGVSHYGEQQIQDISLFPREFFYPYHFQEEYTEDCVKSETYAVHHWSKSWWPESKRRKKKTSSLRNRIRAGLKKIIPIFSYYNALYDNYGYLGIRLRCHRVVQEGPFQGTKYVSWKAKGSKLFPKLIGCYEDSLHEAIYDLLDRDYEKIINVGCGEGYYAVGLARLFPKAKIFAYDMNPSAIKLVLKNAAANSVDQRINAQCSVYDQCKLKQENFHERTLIFCDIEGYELELFNEDSIQHLSNVDLIVELHDFVDASTKSRILSLFSESHSAVVYRQRTLSQAMEHFLRKRKQTRKLLNLFDEDRPEIMEWAVLYSKQLDAESERSMPEM
jgi:mannosyltransferase OCH1-like enzyme